MPRAVLKDQKGPDRTRWTFSRDGLDSPGEAHRDEVAMQANGFYFHDEPPLPRYGSYDGSEYSAPPPPPTTGSNGAHHDNYDYNTPIDERASHLISLKTRVRSQHLQAQDAVGQHLLYETALLDSQAFESMDIGDVDALKKEHARLETRIESATRKLALETKVKDAAHNLQRLYAGQRQHRADTPQSPESPRKSRSSFVGLKGRTSSGAGAGNVQPLLQADNEVAVSMKKVEELNETVRGLLDRRQHVERKLLRHTAAVLADQMIQQESTSGKATSDAALSNGHLHPPQDHHGAYAMNEFDGIRDILSGFPVGSNDQSRKGSSKLQEEHEQQMARVQGRLEQLNSQMRQVLDEVSRTRGKSLGPEPQLDDQDQDVNARLDKRFALLEDNLRSLGRENEDVKSHYKHVQDSAFTTRNAVEEQLERLNHQVHNTLLLSADMQAMQSLREPPHVTGHGYQQQLQYLADSLSSMESLLQQHNAELKNARGAGDSVSKAVEEAQAKSNTHFQKAAAYETALTSLWKILQSDPAVPQRPSNRGALSRDTAVDEPLSPPHTPLREDFSLEAFSSRVQALFDRAQTAREQEDVLKRQLQQHRDLNGKSGVDKDKQLKLLREKHEQLIADHRAGQGKLNDALARHAKAESESGRSRAELMGVKNELGALKSTHQTAPSSSKDVENLESKIVQLSMELTQTKAELDMAQGSRAERALKEPHSSSDRTRQLETELHEMTAEYQDLARESLELEKERAHTEQLIDTLRDRCDALQSQLTDERVRWLGVSKTSGAAAEVGGQGLLPSADGKVSAVAAKESTSMTVLRAEFKKMMREARAEGVRLLRAEQDQRRQIEAEVRRLRQASLAPNYVPPSTNAVPSVANAGERDGLARA